MKITLDCEFCFKRTIIQVEEEQDIVKFCPHCGESQELEHDEEELLFDS
jgi:phage FluMu protein Com